MISEFRIFEKQSDLRFRESWDSNSPAAIFWADTWLKKKRASGRSLFFWYFLSSGSLTWVALVPSSPNHSHAATDFIGPTCSPERQSGHTWLPG